MKSIHIIALALGLFLIACGNTTQRPGSITGLVISPGGNVGNQSLAIDPSLVPTRRLPKESIKAGEVVVKFKPGLGLQSVQSLSANGKTLSLLRPTALERVGLYRADGLSEAQTIQLAQQLAQRSDVEYAEPNYTDYPLRTPNDQFYGAQWHYPLINMPAAWDKTVGSASVTIAVIDTGIIKHPDLDSKILPGYDFVSDPTNARDGGGRDGDPTDTSTFEETSFHGSHVAGTVSAASDNTTGVAGVSWNSRVVPVRALGVEGGSTSDIADAILWSAGLPVSGVPANPNPVQVINMSLGGKGPCPSVYQDAINQATQRGVIVVVAAGNEDDDTANYRPASCDNTITVGAVGPQGTRAPYSNYGALIDIMAPGGDLTQRIDFNGKSYAAGVLSTSGGTSGPSYIFINGTSMASPHVAGIVALMKSQNPSLNYTQALAQLKASAKPLDASQCNRPSGADCGPGLVDVAKALGGSGTTPPPPPPPPAQNVSTFVVAFYCLNITCLDHNGDLDIDIRKSKAITVKQIQTRTTYSVTNLPPATYLAAGWQDLNDNQEVDDNEPLGVYPGQVFVDPGIRVRNIDIPLVPFKVSQASIAREPGDSSVAREPGDLRRRLREVMQR